MTATDQPLGSEHHYTDEEMHNEAVAHEHGDVNFHTVLAFGVAILVVVAIASGLMYGLFVAFEKQAKARDPEVSPYAVTNHTPPRGPQLLTNEPKYLREFRAEEHGKLESYGWVNQGQALAHVPIDLAKKLVVQHGLPVRAGVADDKTLGTHAPAYGESSGGRTIPVTHAVPPPASPGGTEPQPAPKEQAPAVQEIKK
jgi:hypothetical protein